jgi:hypothetical protein
MSGLGQTLPIRAFWTMSGLPPVATELRTSRIGSFGPKAGTVGEFFLLIKLASILAAFAKPQCPALYEAAETAAM